MRRSSNSIAIAHYVFEVGAEVLRGYPIPLPNSILQVINDVVVEWWNIGRESIVQLSLDSDVLSRSTLCGQGFNDLPTFG